LLVFVTDRTSETLVNEEHGVEGLEREFVAVRVRTVRLRQFKPSANPGTKLIKASEVGRDIETWTFFGSNPQARLGNVNAGVGTGDHRGKHPPSLHRLRIPRRMRFFAFTLGHCR
jgi:hypothetical protein